MAELLTDEIIIEKLAADGFMEEPDGPWILEYIDDNYTLKIYSESTYDGYDIYWCTHDDKPYVSQDGFYYEDYNDWSDRALNELESGSDVWIESHIWDDMEWEFNHRLQEWWQDVYEDLCDERKEELLDSGDYYEEKEEE